MTDTVGRQRELGCAHERLTADVPGSVLFVGPAGIGKSTLLDATVDAVVGSFQIRRARAAAAETDLPFVGLHDLIGADLDDGVGDLSDPLRRALDVVLLRAEPGAERTDALAVNLAVLEVLQAMAERQPVLLVLDDLQWLDPPTRGVLGFALRRLADSGVAVLAASRETDSSPLPEPLALIDVEPLTAAEIADVVALRVGQLPTPAKARVLHRMSGGNPFLAVELARSSASVPATITEIPLPERYRPVLAARMADLTPVGRNAALAAALLSRPTSDLLARVGGSDGLVDLQTAGIMRVAGQAVEFDHPLMAAAFRDLAGPDNVRGMHQQLSGIVDEPTERARHLALAAAGADEALAAEIEDVAHEAASRAAIDTAAELATHAATLTPPRALDDRVRRAVAAAGWFHDAGEPARSRGILEPLLEVLPEGPLRARCLNVLAYSKGQDIAGILELYREALAQPAVEPDVELDVRMNLAGCLLISGDLDGARRELGAPHHPAADPGLAELVASVDLLRGEIDYCSGIPLAESAAWARARKHSWENPPVYGHPERVLAIEASHGDDQATAAGLLDDLLQRCRQLHDHGSEGALLLHRAEIEVRSGRLDAAAESADTAYRITADGVRDQFPLYVRAHVAAWQGSLEDARALAGEGLVMAREAGDAIFEAQCLLVLGFVEVSAGRYEAACRYESDLRDQAFRSGCGHPGTFRWQGDAVEAFVAVDRVDDARQVTDEVWRQADRLELNGSRALAARCDGLIHAHDGDLKLAEDSLLQSLSLMDGLEMPLERARSLLALGVVRRRSRQKVTARDVLDEARDIFAASGAAVWTQRAEDELNRAAGAHAGQDLTIGEASVAELAAGGATNREIAGQLFLSPKTVETTLTRVYRKLGVRSRTELARHPAVRTGVGEGEGRGIP